MAGAGDLLVRGGTVVDGTGAPERRSDVRVRAGVITEVAPDLRPDGEPQLDASGAYVTPGMIEAHTHFDASLWWDPLCEPMPAYGTTTVVMGNCGLGLAPIRDGDRDELIDLFCFIEDLPVEGFLGGGVPWTWSSWPEYRRQAAGHPTAVNAVAFMPHQFLRVWVMGHEAWERPATDAERTQMAALLTEALAAGAFGLSTSAMDTDRRNRPVPSRMADDAEYRDLFAALAAAPGSIFQYVPRFLQPEHYHQDLDAVVPHSARFGVPVLWGGHRLEHFAAEQRQATEAYAAPYWQQGVPLAPLYSVRPTHVNYHFERSIMWHGVAAWHDLVIAPQEDKRRMLSAEGWRQRARADWDACTFTLADIRNPQRFRFVGGPDAGLTLADVIERDRRHPSDVLADFLLATDVRGNLRSVERPVDDEAAARAVRDPHMVAGASDAGAHIQMFSGAGDATYLIAHLARDTGLVTLPEAVHAVTGKQARFFGLPDRGVVAPGMAGDLAVFDLAEITSNDEVPVSEPATGSWRYSRLPGGYRATVVAGEATWLDGAATGARPGGLLGRSGVRPATGG